MQAATTVGDSDRIRLFCQRTDSGGRDIGDPLVALYTVDGSTRYGDLESLAIRDRIFEGEEARNEAQRVGLPDRVDWKKTIEQLVRGMGPEDFSITPLRPQRACDFV